MTTELERIRSGLLRAAWGYIFLYFNININQISLLPAFVGYILFLAAIAAARCGMGIDAHLYAGRDAAFVECGRLADELDGAAD